MKKLIKLRCHSRDALKFNLKMKLTTFLLIVSLFKIQANTYSQNTKVSINLENVTVEQIIDEIENKTEFKFLFDTNEVDLNRSLCVTRSTLVAFRPWCMAFSIPSTNFFFVHLSSLAPQTRQTPPGSGCLEGA